MFYGSLYLSRSGAISVTICNGISLFCTSLMLVAFMLVPALSRRQLSRTILAQCIADLIWSLASMVMQFTTDCGVVMNKYLFVLSVYSAAWSCVLAFHLLQQAKGHWVEVEHYGMRYHFAVASVTLAMAMIVFGEQRWDFRPCYPDDKEGVDANGIGVIVMVVFSMLWQLIAYIWLRAYLRIKLYTARYLIAYVIAWSGFFAWYSVGINSTNPDHQQGFVAAAISLLGLLGAINVLLFGTMPPTYILRRIHVTISDNIAHKFGDKYDADRPTTSELGSLEDKLLGDAGIDHEAAARVNDTEMARRSSSTTSRRFFIPSEEVTFDQAAEDYLWFNLKEQSNKNATDGLILPARLIHIQESVGTGSFSTVYRGDYQNMTVAVKELRCILTRGGGLKNRQNFSEFLSEVEIMTSARHTNLARLVGLSMRENGKLLIISEFYKENLRHYLAWEGRTCTEYNKIRICHEVASGLAFLHEKLIIHRDVKPENIFLDDHHQAKLGDFGCSQAEAALNSSKVFGTPAYLAPEIFDLSRAKSKRELLPVFGQGVKLTPATIPRYSFSTRRATYSGPIRLDAISPKLDIYALGITFWEVMTGQIPYTNLTFARSRDLYAAVTEGLRPDPFELRASHRSLAELCWAFNSSTRPSAVDLCVMLKDLQNNNGQTLPRGRHTSSSFTRRQRETQGARVEA